MEIKSDYKLDPKTDAEKWEKAYWHVIKLGNEAHDHAHMAYVCSLISIAANIITNAVFVIAIHIITGK